ncbi:chondroitin sulfate proteoglycan 5-like isoform X2 [Brienomyrus brachyistius]|uniref:chondroitin sulfate proteoglycan 5-like isoform X2 n=1 Tax=Brienomyrus brachyistius TaxID=42636 RepID=UPI0020B35517|nr:chondroitin sulfate proteoglycan 5-like isoform X2 [Brienomyrus brachyistius]
MQEWAAGKTRFSLGCWALSLVLCLIPLCAHGILLEANVTETGSQANSSRAARRPRGWEEAGSGMTGDTMVGPDGSPNVAEDDHLMSAATTEMPPSHTPTGILPEKDEESMVDLDDSLTPQQPGPLPVQPHPVIFTVSYTDPELQQRELHPPPAKPTTHELRGVEPKSWLTNIYGYLDNYSTTRAYGEDDSASTTDMMDENLLHSTPPSVPVYPRGPRPISPVDTLSSGSGRNEDARLPPGSTSSSGSDCRLGYVRSNGTCRSPCDLFPSYCFNGGQCYLVEGMGVFCRCNVQDYIWHKGSRCESVITEFQVMCIAVGTAALLVLLLLMITVFFGKKLHLLKTENHRLRRRSKHRPTSEQHNDNFSLSTIAEGSHPNKTMNRYTWEFKTKEEPTDETNGKIVETNTKASELPSISDDPNAQNKLEDPVKAPPPKEDEPLNIQNSLTPKHENNKVAAEENSSDVNSLQNNMM